MKTNSIIAGHKIQTAREQFFDKGRVPEGLLSEPVIRSWQRCRSAGLQEDRAPAGSEPLGRLSLEEKRGQSLMLLTHAEPIMETLYEQIRDTGSMVLLADSEGFVLHSLGDPEFVNKAQRVALQPGASWAEHEKGTNAIGTAVTERSAVLVHGSEHYLDRNAFLTCSASPIFDPIGRLLGVLDISGDYRSHQKHTLALVRMSAQIIENRMINTGFVDQVVAYFHPRREFLGTLCEGIAAFSPDGQLLAANANALCQLGINRDRLHERSWRTLFDAPMEALLQRATRESGDQPPVYLHNGMRVFLKMRVGGRRLPVMTFEAANAGSASRTEPARAPKPGGRGPTLECLDTGDERVRTMVDKARRILDRNIPVLVDGESGVGKELFARALHNSGPRRERPFVAVNCASIPETLIESELFGYEEGAFTGAKRKGCPGKIQQADGGTLFLDEIGDMPLALQSRLLRVLQERQITRLGSTKAQAVDFFLVCATHRNLKDLVASGDFREDLYYRLKGIRFALPALRERTDFDALVERLLAYECEGREPTRLSADVMQLFRRHTWPGNIRELQHVLRAAVAMAGPGGEVVRDDLPEEFLEEVAAEAPAAEAPVEAPPMVAGKLEDIEAVAIRRALDDANGNVSAAARRLGISRNTIYRKLAALRESDPAPAK